MRVILIGAFLLGTLAAAAPPVIVTTSLPGGAVGTAYDQAIALAFKAFQVNPRDADVLGSLALYHARKGDTNQAQQFIGRARTIDPGSVSLAEKEAVMPLA